ncbi:MAG: DUF4399 domain-containing protein [Gammaproteobacteria bacterium]|nr:DUF4399 domain-containing protein [Gammaproteobacteria bacterium]
MRHRNAATAPVLAPALALASMLALAPAVGWAQTPAPANARSLAPENTVLYFITPANGETAASPVAVRFGLRNMGVAPAGVMREGTGHHHLLVNTTPPPLDRPIPNDEHHLHFGKGQTETMLELPPGRHTLQLLLGDHNHVPHIPPLLSKRISITVR